MNDPQLVETPGLWPAWCVGCQSQKGPLFDMGVDLPAPGPNGVQHIYLCRRCTRASAKAYGFVKGEKMDELEQAADLLKTLTAERDTATDRLAKAVLAAEDGARKLEQLVEENEFLSGRVKQLEQRLKQQAEADLEVVFPSY